MQNELELMQEIQEAPEQFNESEFAELADRLRNGEETLSFSAIKNFIPPYGSPRMFMAYKLRTLKQTPAMLLGDIIDCILLTPDEFDTRYTVVPSECAKNSLKGLEAWAAFLNGRGIKVDIFGLKMQDAKWIIDLGIQQIEQSCKIVDASQINAAKRIASAVMKNDTAAYFFGEIGETQAPVEYEAFGWKWKGKKDAQGQDFIMDMKLTVSANEKDFLYQIRKMGYLYQAAIYTQGGKDKRDFYFMGYDRTGEVIVVQVGKAHIEKAWDQLAYYIGQFDRMIFEDKFLWSQDFWAKNGIYSYM